MSDLNRIRLASAALAITLTVTAYAYAAQRSRLILACLFALSVAFVAFADAFEVRRLARAAAMRRHPAGSARR